MCFSSLGSQFRANLAELRSEVAIPFSSGIRQPLLPIVTGVLDGRPRFFPF
jgi:hypothetical protein